MLQLAESGFDLVQPGGIRRREVQVNVGVPCQILLHYRRLMGGEIVQDDMDFLIVRLGRNEFS